MVGLPGIREKLPAELSGGMRKRVGARARDRAVAEGPALRRADHRPRPDQRTPDQRADRRAATSACGDLGLRHARPGERLHDQRSAGDDREPPHHRGRHARRAPREPRPDVHQFPRLRCRGRQERAMKRRLQARAAGRRVPRAVSRPLRARDLRGRREERGVRGQDQALRLLRRRERAGEGAAVRLSGLDVGSVSSIEFPEQLDRMTARVEAVDQVALHGARPTRLGGADRLEGSARRQDHQHHPRHPEGAAAPRRGGAGVPEGRGIRGPGGEARPGRDLHHGGHGHAGERSGPSRTSGGSCRRPRTSCARSSRAAVSPTASSTTRSTAPSSRRCSGTRAAS